MTRTIVCAGSVLLACAGLSACTMDRTPILPSDANAAGSGAAQLSAASSLCESPDPKCVALAAAGDHPSPEAAPSGDDEHEEDDDAQATPPADDDAEKPADAPSEPHALPEMPPSAAPETPAMPSAPEKPAAPAMPMEPMAADQTAPTEPGSDIETCYELRAHGKSAAGDATPYNLPNGETYTSFIFKAPWTQPVQGLRFRNLADAPGILHHWILYTESAPAADGDIQPCDLSGLLGFLCGQGETRSMITGWAPGRPDFDLPEGVGLELPAPGSTLALESHYINIAGTPTQDRSGVEVCVTSKFRPNTASISWLGTESIHVPAMAEGNANGTCHPQRAGMTTADPIHILYSWPHMHRLGRHLTSVVNHAAGGQEVLYDGAFDFDQQIVHDTPYLLAPGDSISTTCTYQNTTPAAVSFGQSTSEEMCFNFVYAWPAHALDNPNGNFGEAQNTCLH